MNDFMREYILIFVRRIWLIILLAILGGGISTYVTITTYVPQYKASVTMLVVNNGYDPSATQTYADILAGQQLVKEYKEIIKSRGVTKAVINELGLKNMSAEGLAKNVSVSLVSETRILQVTVTNDNPELSAKLANSFSRVFTEKVQEVMKNQNVAVIDIAEQPTSPVDPQHKKNIAIGGFAGILIGFLIVYLMGELDESIKTPEEVERYLGIKVLGVIPKSKRKSVKK